MISEQYGPKAIKDNDIQGPMLINKTLTILSTRYLTNDDFIGSSHYSLKINVLSDSVSLIPSNNFGGYCFLEDNYEAIKSIAIESLISLDEREAVRFNSNHGVIAKFITAIY